MSAAEKIVAATIRIFNLVTFLAASALLVLLSLYLFQDWKIANSLGMAIFAFVLLGINGAIIWKTGKWLFVQAYQIHVLRLMTYWGALIILFILLLFLEMGNGGRSLSNERFYNERLYNERSN